MKKKLAVYSLILFLVFLTGCGGGGGGGGSSSSNAKIYIDEGWSEYENKNYNNAINKFNTALSANPDDSQASEAYTGIGWSYLQLHNYDLAINNFDLAETKNKRNQDAYIGELSGLCMRQKEGDFNKAIEAGEIAKSLIGLNYQFSHYPYTKYTDVISLLALSYYYVGNYEKCRENVNIVLEKEPNHTLALLLNELLKIIGE